MTEDLHRLRHSAAHILAQAVKRLWPGTKLAIGPPIEEGFYYDVAPEGPLTDQDLPKIEAEMAKIVKENAPFQQTFMSKPEAVAFFEKRGEPFKVEILQEILDEKVSIYTDGDFIDLCEGPHVASTGRVKAFKVLSLAGAYWRGNDKNPQLTRIYGTAFFDEKELSRFLEVREEAKRRDHRKLGVQLKLYSIFEEAGAGLVFYHPRGATLRQTIEEYSRREHGARGYQPVVTPHVLRSDIWVRSGHYKYYKPNMYIFQAEGLELGLKPMNCPGHILIYQSQMRSYRELPVRFFELGTVYRNEKSSVLHGLLRVRGFTQDDAHIFCRPSQLEGEITEILSFITKAMGDFGFSDYKVELSTRPPEFLGNDEEWNRAEEILKGALKKNGVTHAVSAGTGAFYGPKIDIHVKDTLGRFWQCATVQLDFVLPERFGLTYIEESGQQATPAMIHRAIFGSLERFLGTLIEQYAGAFPLWLSPVQAVVIPVAQDQEPYAAEVWAALLQTGLRVEQDVRRQTLQARIRDAELLKVPYMLIVGKRELAARQVAVRARGVGDLGAMGLTQFVDRVKVELEKRR